MRLLIDTRSTLSLLKRSYIRKDQGLNSEFTPSVVSASGERIAILGKVSTLVQFTSTEKFQFRRPIAFWVVNDETLPGIAGLLGSDVLSKYQAEINMGSKVLNFYGLRFVLEDAPLVTTEMAQRLFPICMVEENVNNICSISDTEYEKRNFKEEIFWGRRRKCWGCHS